MIRDRGTKKWTAMMLPEHKRMLQYLYKELDYKEKPFLDEQKHEQLNYMMQKAMGARKIMEITYYENGSFKSVKGVINSVSIQKGEVQVIDQDMEVKILFLADIIEMGLG